MRVDGTPTLEERIAKIQADADSMQCHEDAEAIIADCLRLLASQEAEVATLRQERDHFKWRSEQSNLQRDDAVEKLAAAEAEIARLRALLEAMAHDSAKYPQLRLPEMQQHRLERALAQPAETDHE